MAAALTACEDNKVVCTVLDPATGSSHQVTAISTCPPATSVRTTAQSATPHTVGWYFVGGQPRYGKLPRGAQPATLNEAEALEANEEAAEATAHSSNAQAESETRGGSDFGETGSGRSGG